VLGADTAPVLAWTVNDARRADTQAAYEIRVNGWDSGRVASADSTDVRYSGPALASNTNCTWSVRTWDAQGSASPWSAAARFDTGLLAASDWTAWWSQVDDGALVLSDVTVTKPVATERLYFGAQGPSTTAASCALGR
jgi:alpha-L-rhamnosidase